jgi:RNA ligase
VKLSDIMDEVALATLIEQHYITERWHPTLPLRVLNYTEKAMYSRNWTPETVQCRGLIVGADGTIVSRPFRKFWNLGETSAQAVPDEPFAAYEKLDGSLGISYIDADGLPSLATRGSFVSPQAKRGTEILRQRLSPDDLEAMAEHCQSLTFCYEIILPENRIVVDYGGREDLVLLAVFETDTGRELDDAELVGEPFPRPKRWGYAGLADLLTAADAVEGPDFDGQEGVVVRFASGLRLKIKRAEYVRLHRLVTGITPRRIWELLKAGDSTDRLFDGTSEGFQAWARAHVHRLQQTHDWMGLEARDTFWEIVGAELPDRKTFAAQATTHGSLTPILFRLYDEKPYDEIIWKLLRPGPADPFHVEV